MYLYFVSRLISIAKYVLSSVSIGSRANKVWNIPLTYCTLYHDAAPGCLIRSFCKNRKWTTSSTDLLQAYRRVVYKAPTRRPDRLPLRILHFRALRLILLPIFFPSSPKGHYKLVTLLFATLQGPLSDSIYPNHCPAIVPILFAFQALLSKIMFLAGLTVNVLEFYAAHFSAMTRFFWCSITHPRK